MDSKKSRPNHERSALEPQRRRGELRVASLMEAAAAVIAERGYESATMADIAARAGAQIGSLYHFFPNKEVLADALIHRYGELIDEAFGRIEGQVSSLSANDLADSLVGLLVALHGETRAVVALLEARSDWSIKRTEFRNAALQLHRADPDAPLAAVASERGRGHCCRPAAQHENHEGADSRTRNRHKRRSGGRAARDESPVPGKQALGKTVSRRPRSASRQF